MLSGQMDRTMRFNHRQARQEGARVNGVPLQSITAVIRAVEFFVFLAVISRFTLTFPSTVLNLSGDYFRHVSIAFVSTPFIFFLGNVIVVTLILKSGSKHSDYEEAPQPKTTFIVSVYSSTVVGKSSPATEVKASCYRRTNSEKMAGERKRDGGEPVLRRTKTETVQRRVTRTCKGSYLEDHMSGDEFRRTVEDFIARQQRILKEEEEDGGSFSE